MRAKLFCLLLAGLLAQAREEPLKTTLCEIFTHPQNFKGKLVEVRAAVESGVDDLPAALTDDTCGAELKFLTPDEQHFARLIKDKQFQKLIKDVKKSPFVIATITGRIVDAGTREKPESGLAIESVQDIVMKTPKVRRGS
jgi:hypothetical protein